MKKFLLLTLLTSCCISAFSQSKVVCCSNPSATQKFAMLASNKGVQDVAQKPFENALSKQRR